MTKHFYSPTDPHEVGKLCPCDPITTKREPVASPQATRPELGICDLNNYPHRLDCHTLLSPDGKCVNRAAQPAVGTTPTRNCCQCNAPISRCMGFVKASDFVDLLNGVRPGIVDGHCNIRELCGKCSEVFMWDGENLIKRESEGTTPQGERPKGKAQRLVDAIRAVAPVETPCSCKCKDCVFAETEYEHGLGHCGVKPDCKANAPAQTRLTAEQFVRAILKPDPNNPNDDTFCLHFPNAVEEVENREFWLKHLPELLIEFAEAFRDKSEAGLRAKLADAERIAELRIEEAGAFKEDNIRLYGVVEAAEAEAVALRKRERWISVEEKLPEIVRYFGGRDNNMYGESAIIEIFSRDGERNLGWLYKSGTWESVYGGIIDEVTHWKALSAAPEVKS